jgi:hypothetical protein
VKNKDRGRRKRQGQKGHFTAVLSPPELEMNILMCLVFSNKFGNDKSVYHRSIFGVRRQKRRTLSVSKGKFCLYIHTGRESKSHTGHREWGTSESKKYISHLAFLY